MRIVKRQSWFSRIANSFVGALFGGILTVVSLVLLFVNEGRAVKTARSLEEGSHLVQHVPHDSIAPEHESHLIHVQGPTFVEGDLTDEEFGVRVNAVRLQRIVEMYQWDEDKEVEHRRRSGGTTERIEHYTYKKVWSSNLINSREFKQSGHDNPGAFPISSRNQPSSAVYLGSFRFPSSLVDQIAYSNPLPVKLETVSDSLREKLQERGGELYWPVDPAATSAKIGDARIRFEVTMPIPVSVVAKQEGQWLNPYKTSNGRELHMLSPGNVSAEQMFDKAKATNTMLTWVLRGFGTLLSFAGLAMMLHVFSVMVDIVPFAGSIVGAGTGFIAFLMACIISLTTISIGWIVYRPLLGIGLLAAAIACIVLLVKRLRQNRTVPATIVAPPPVPTPPPLP